MASKRRIAIGGLIGIGAVLLLIVLVVAGGGLFLKTDAGRNWLAARIEAAASGPDQRLAIGAITGDLFSGFTLEGVKLADDEGEWLAIDRVAVDWVPVALLSRRLDVERLDVAGVILSRLPQGGNTQPTQGTGIPQLPIDIDLKRFSLQDVALGPEAMGVAAVIEASGDARVTRRDGYAVSINGRRVDRADGTLTAKAAYDPATDRLDVDVALHAPENGVVTTLIGAPARPLDLTVKGNGLLADWQGTIRMTSGDMSILDLGLTLNRQDRIAVGLKGTVDPRSLIRAPLLDAAYDLSGRFEVDTEAEKVNIDVLALDGPPASLRLFGSADLTQSTLDLLFQFQPLDHAAIDALTTPVKLGDTSVDGRISGPFADPTLSLNVLTKHIDAAGNALDGVFVNLMADRDADGYAIRGSGGADKVAAGGLVLTPSFTFDTHIENDFSRADLKNVTLVAEGGRITAKGVVPFADGAMRVDVAADFPGRKGGADMISALLAPGFKGGVTVLRESPTAPIRLTDLALDHPWVGAKGFAAFGAGARQPLASLDVTVKNVQALAGAFGTEASGNPVAVKVTVGGDWAAPVVNAVLDMPSLDVAGQAFRDVKATVAMTPGAADARQGRLVLTGTTPLGATDLQGDFAIPAKGPIAISNLALTSDAATLMGALTVPVDGTPVTGRIDGTVASDEVAKRFGVPLQGMPTLALDLGNALGSQEATLTLGGKDVAIDTATLASAKISVLMTGADIDFTADAAGALHGPATFSTAGSLIGSGDMMSLRIRALTAKMGRQEVALQNSVQVVRRGGRYEIEPVTLKVDTGEVRIALRQRVRDMRVDVDLKSVPLSILNMLQLPVGFGGTLSGNVDLMAQGDSASGNIKLALDGLSMTGGTTRLDGLKGTVDGKWDGRRLDLAADIDGTGAAALKLTAAVPMQYGDKGLALPPDGPIAADLTWSGEVAPLWQFLEMEADFLTGKADAHVRVAGTVAKPQINGMVTLADGTYRNIDAGAQLQKVNARVRLETQQAVIEDMTATDGKSGTLSASGGVTFAPGAAPQARITVDFKNLQAVQRPEVTASASGQIVYQMADAASTVTGKITTNHVEVRLVNASASEVTPLPVTEIPKPLERVEDEEPAAPAMPIMLDIDVRMPQEVFIRGRGLDSEWQGNIHISGPMEAMKLVGSVNVVRGNFNFAGRQFALAQGTVQFTGNVPMDPSLNIEADYDTTDLTAKVLITGTASDIKLALSSTPVLPQDEILSRILFNNGATSLSPIEAVQLAAAMRSLASGGGGGLLGSTRGALGLDVLSVGAADNNGGGTVVKGGKYLTRNVYLEVQSGTDPGSQKVGVQVRVTKNLSVQTEIKEDTGSDIGLYWKRNY